MSKNELSLHVEEMEKFILYPGSDPDQSQNLIDCFSGGRSIIPQNLIQIRQ